MKKIGKRVDKKLQRKEELRSEFARRYEMKTKSSFLKPDETGTALRVNFAKPLDEPDDLEKYGRNRKKFNEDISPSPELSNKNS